VRIDRGNINESVWVEDHELPVMELNDPLVSQIAQYPVDVNAGETGGIADMLLRQRQLHLFGPMPRPLGAIPNEQLQQQTGDTLTRGAPSDAGEMIE
jgi:hypothetical protein